MNIWALFRNNSSQLAKFFDNFFSRFESIHAIKSCSRVSHNSVFIHNYWHFNSMTHSHFKVIWIVCTSYLYSASTKIWIHKFVRNNWNHSVNQRKQYFLANHVLITWVIRVNCNRAIAHHCFRTCCCYGDRGFIITISNLNKFTRIIAVLNFNI